MLDYDSSERGWTMTKLSRIKVKAFSYRKDNLIEGQSLRGCDDDFELEFNFERKHFWFSLWLNSIQSRLETKILDKRSSFWKVGSVARTTGSPSLQGSGFESGRMQNRVLNDAKLALKELAIESKLWWPKGENIILLIASQCMR